MTGVPPPQPLQPVLARMALGLGLLVLGAGVLWRSVELTPTPGLATVHTPFAMPLDGPLPLDLAAQARIELETDRATLHVSPLPAGSPELLSGDAKHRARNLPEIEPRRLGRDVRFRARLAVPPLPPGGVPVNQPRPVQHELNLTLSSELPLTLSTRSVGGPQRLDLRSLRLRAVTARSDSGDLDLTLPARIGGPYAVVTRRGAVTLRAEPGARPEAVRVNSLSGNLRADLGGAELDALGVGTQSGQVSVTLPRRLSRGVLSSISGDLTVTARTGTQGNLDIRSQSGRVTLRLERGTQVRVRFADRAALLRPPGLRAPQLDIFVDAPAERFSLSEGEGGGQPD